MALEKNKNEYNFNIVQGDTFNIRLTYQNSDGTPINLTGYSAFMEVRDKPGGKILCATASVSDGITITSASGIVDVSLTSAKTNVFTTPRAAYQVQIDNGQSKYTLLYGWFNVNAGVIN